MSHNPNPFDFVPFADDEPTLKTLEEWLAYGNRRSGSIKVEMKALTPVHIAGEQPMVGKNIKESHFYQRHGKHYISGSSIRGVLRAFIEAACNGWASQLTPYYEKKNKHHSIGFKVVDSETDSTVDIDRNLPTALNQAFTVPPSANKGIDLASFIFGYVPGKDKDNDQFNPAWKGLVTIDDTEVKTSQLSFGQNKYSYEIPDLNDSDAFMGGPHPSASSWWYQYPHAIHKDEIPIDNNRTVINYHFIGSGFRGRKFYFHQDPKKSVQKYRDLLKWNLLNFAPIECFEKGNSVTFDVFFKNIPEKILNILLFALEPGKRIRHKIGYGKAYGYGSIEFSIQDIVYQSKGFNDSISVDLEAKRKTMREQLTYCDTEDKNSIAHFLYKQSLEALSFILWYEESLGYIFTYPSPGENGFNVNHKEEKRTAYNGELRRSIVKSLKTQKFDPNGKGTIKISPQIGKAIAIELKEIKPTLHFAVYQESSTDGKNEIYIKLKKERANNYL